MGRIRRTAIRCQEIGAWYGTESEEPADDDADTYAERTQVACALPQGDGKSHRKNEKFLNEMPGILDSLSSWVRENSYRAFEDLMT